MQPPNAEDTEWNAQLRKFGIIHDKKNNELEIQEEQLVKMFEETVRDKLDTEKQLDKLELNELEELEDDLDEAVLEKFRQRRITEMMNHAKLPSFGSVDEITAASYVNEVNKAGENVSVVLHLYQPGNFLCNVIDHALIDLAKSYIHCKFLRSRSTLCIENYPDALVPTLFLYRDGKILTKLVGPNAFGQQSVTLKSITQLLKALLKKNNCLAGQDLRAARLEDDEDNLPTNGFSDEDDTCKDHTRRNPRTGLIRSLRNKDF